MASTFLVRLRVGEILMDAKGVSRLYRSRSSGAEAWLLVGAAVIAVGLIAFVSPALRLFVSQNVNDILDWVRRAL